MREMKEIYLISPDIKWSIFKKLYGIVPDTGPTTKELPRVLWEMVRDKQIYCFFDNPEGEMAVSTKLPKNKKIIIIKNPTK